ncbi:MAG: septum formation initiator family protein [Bacilli bacterium]|nr:septum formation initiator family protein [Bacilli bacterium]MDD4607702.1 septum formation initiator family protein [Bacilli bacterium]
MTKKVISKQSKRRLAILVPLFLVSITFFLLSFISSSINLYNLKKESKHLEKEIVELKETEQELKTEIDKLKDPDYVARYARENYLYSKDGEIVFKFNESDKKDKDVEIQDNSIYYIIGVGSFLLLILVIVFRKKREK